MKFQGTQIKVTAPRKHISMAALSETKHVSYNQRDQILTWSERGFKKTFIIRPPDFISWTTEMLCICCCSSDCEARISVFRPSIWISLEHLHSWSTPHSAGVLLGVMWQLGGPSRLNSVGWEDTREMQSSKFEAERWAFMNRRLTENKIYYCSKWTDEMAATWKKDLITFWVIKVYCYFDVKLIS